MNMKQVPIPPTTKAARAYKAAFKNLFIVQSFPTPFIISRSRKTGISVTCPVSVALRLRGTYRKSDFTSKHLRTLLPRLWTFCPAQPNAV
jgi:hypothetical protein